MSRGTRADFYHSKTWERTAKAYKRSKSGLCERCLKEGQIEPGIIVHHKIYLTEENLRDEDISLSFDNLELLCRKCHAEEHAQEARRGRNKARRWTISEDGSVFIKEK